MGLLMNAVASNFSIRSSINNNNSFVHNGVNNLNFSLSHPNSEDEEITLASLRNTIVSKLDSISLDLRNFNTRISNNEYEIHKIKGIVSQKENKINTLTASKNIVNNSSVLTSKVLSEQEERRKRTNHIMVYNLPELNLETPTNLDDKKKFFTELTAFNNNSISKLLSTLDPDITNTGLYTKRLGKFVLNKSRPLLVVLKSATDIKLVFKNIKNLKSSDSFKSIVITPALTAFQRTQLKDIKALCLEKNNLNKNPDFFWKVIDPYVNPRIIKQSKNLVTKPPQWEEESG